MSHTVEIEHLDSVYLLPPDHLEPQRVRWQLDRIVRTRLDAALERALDETFDSEDERVCVIDELEVDVALEADGDEDALAGAWATAIAAAVRSALDEPRRGDRVRRFESRAHQLAAFLADMGDGRAWDRGCYAAFDGLRALPSQATIREALARDPDTARAALAMLAAQRRLDPVLAALGEREAERVAATLARGASATSGAVVAVLGVWPEVLGDQPARPGDALRLGAAAAANPSADRPAPVALAAAARALVALAAARAAGETERAEALLWELAPAAPGLAERIEATVTEVARRPSSDILVSTAYAGAFLLLAGLLDLDADRVLAELAPEEASVASLRLALLARCLGSPDAAADPGVRLAAGAGEEPECEPVGDGWGAPQRLLLERLVRLGRADGRRLLLERVEDNEGRSVLVRDADHDAWLALLDATGAEAAAVRLATGAFEREPESVVWSERACDLDGPPGTMALLARALLRELAVRLPGLGRSSPIYLRENFLVGAGTIRLDGDVLEVRLAPSPLRIVLQLAGVHGRTLDVPWLGEVVLRLPEP